MDHVSPEQKKTDSPVRKKNPDRRNVVLATISREIGGHKYHNKLGTDFQYTAEEQLIERFLSNSHSIVECRLPDISRSTYLMAFSRDGRMIASCHGNHNVYVTDMQTGKNLKTLSGHPRTPWCIEFHPSSSQILASGCLGGQVRVWDLHGGSEKWTIAGNSVIASLAFHPTERLLVIASSNEVLFWDWSQPAPFARCSTLRDRERVRYVAFDYAGSKLITGISNKRHSLERNQNELTLQSRIAPRPGSFGPFLTVPPHSGPRQEGSNDYPWLGYHRRATAGNVAMPNNFLNLFIRPNVNPFHMSPEQASSASNSSEANRSSVFAEPSTSRDTATSSVFQSTEGQSAINTGSSNDRAQNGDSNSNRVGFRNYDRSDALNGNDVSNFLRGNRNENSSRNERFLAAWVHCHSRFDRLPQSCRLLNLARSLNEESPRSRDDSSVSSAPSRSSNSQPRPQSQQAWPNSESSTSRNQNHIGPIRNYHNSAFVPYYRRGPARAHSSFRSHVACLSHRLTRNSGQAPGGGSDLYRPASNGTAPQPSLWLITRPGARVTVRSRIRPFTPSTVAADPAPALTPSTLTPTPNPTSAPSSPSAPNPNALRQSTDANQNRLTTSVREFLNRLRMWQLRYLTQLQQRTQLTQLQQRNQDDDDGAVLSNDAGPDNAERESSQTDDQGGSVDPLRPLSSPSAPARPVCQCSEERSSGRGCPASQAGCSRFLSFSSPFRDEATSSTSPPARDVSPLRSSPSTSFSVGPEPLPNEMSSRRLCSLCGKATSATFRNGRIGISLSPRSAEETRESNGQESMDTTPEEEREPPILRMPTMPTMPRYEESDSRPSLSQSTNGTNRPSPNALRSIERRSSELLQEIIEHVERMVFHQSCALQTLGELTRSMGLVVEDSSPFSRSSGNPPTAGSDPGAPSPPRTPLSASPRPSSSSSQTPAPMSASAPPPASASASSSPSSPSSPPSPSGRQESSPRVNIPFSELLDLTPALLARRVQYLRRRHDFDLRPAISSVTHRTREWRNLYKLLTLNLHLADHLLTLFDLSHEIYRAHGRLLHGGEENPSPSEDAFFGLGQQFARSLLNDLREVVGHVHAVTNVACAAAVSWVYTRSPTNRSPQSPDWSPPVRDAEASSSRQSNELGGSPDRLASMRPLPLRSAMNDASSTGRRGGIARHAEVTQFRLLTMSCYLRRILAQITSNNARSASGASGSSHQNQAENAAGPNAPEDDRHRPSYSFRRPVPLVQVNDVPLLESESYDFRQPSSLMHSASGEDYRRLFDMPGTSNGAAGAESVTNDGDVANDGGDGDEIAYDVPPRPSEARFPRWPGDAFDSSSSGLAPSDSSGRSAEMDDDAMDTDDPDSRIFPLLLPFHYRSLYRHLNYIRDPFNLTNNSILLNQRIQVWDFSKGAIPDLTSINEENLVVAECKINNDASVDISGDGQFLVALMCVSNRASVRQFVGVYSLRWDSLGQVLYRTSFEQMPVSVSLSPTASHLVVGMASRRSPLPYQPAMAQVFRLEGARPGRTIGARGRLLRVCNLKLGTDRNRQEGDTVSLNCIRWAAVAGQGLVFGTNTGQLTILR